MKRTLRLRRETLTELGTEMLAVVGGVPPQPTPPQQVPQTLHLEECFALSVYLNCGDLTAQPRCF